MSRIAIVSIPVADQQRSKRFYAEVLGFKVIRDNPMGPDQQWIQLAPSEGTATVTLVTWFEKMLGSSGNQYQCLTTGCRATSRKRPRLEPRPGRGSRMQSNTNLLDLVTHMEWADAVLWRSSLESTARDSRIDVTVLQSMLQVTMHTVHHRGQVAARLRELDIEPPLIDFIAWPWQGNHVQIGLLRNTHEKILERLGRPLNLTVT